MALHPELQTERSTLTIFEQEVTLERVAGVFTPTPHGLFYANAAYVRAGERVIDIGTGSGVIAIAAAKVGARVVATDIDPRAVAAAERNAALNGVSIETSVGELFGGATGAFDVILANLPNELVAPEYLATLSPDEARGFAGGEGGHESLVALLDAAPRHMNARSRLYLPVYTITDYHGLLSAALARFATRLVAFVALPVKPYVLEHLAYYRALDEAGTIKLFRDATGRWRAYDYVYELTLLVE